MKYFSFIVLSFLVGMAVNQPSISHEDSIKSVKLPNGTYWISPLLECEYHAKANPKINSLKQRIKNTIQLEKRNGNILEASVYFRDLNNGPNFTINPKARYTGASLLKVPVMMAFLLRSEVEEGLLHKEILFQGIEDDNYYSLQNFSPEKTLVEGEKYSVEELIYYMIVYSDNAAVDTLFYYWPELNINILLQDLGLQFSIDGDKMLIDVKSYSILFRVLYNATFLNKDNSNKALSILSQASLKEGLKAGIPKDIRIARKFGENANDKIYQFHDCGIIYNKNRPYLLCIMTKSKKSFIKATSLVEDLSHLVYSELNR